MGPCLIPFFVAFNLLCLQPFVLAQNSFRTCLKSAVGGDSSCVAFPDLFFDLLHVHRYNLYYDIKPAAVTYPESAQAVSKLVKCAAQHEIKVQARSGGHSFGDYCIGGTSGALVIDLKHLNHLSYDSNDQTANLGPGNRLEDVNEFLLEYHRIVPHGDAPQVGVGGHYTIGGLGRISRQFGAAVDQVIDAEVVLANGDIVRASSRSHQDVYFAIRGAGASFGIVTDFHVKTHPAPGSAIAYTYNVTVGDAQLQADAFKAWQKLISDPKLDWRISSQFLVFPFECVITGFFFGTKKEFSALNLQSAIPGLDENAMDIKIMDDAVAIGQEISKLALQLFGDVSTHFYSKSMAFTQKTLMSDKAVDAMFAYLTKGALSINTLKAPWFVIFDLEAGAINVPKQESTAYALRDAIYFLQSYAVDVLGIFKKDTRNFLDGLNQVIKEHNPKVEGSYPGYVDPFLPNAQHQYWRSNLPKLQQIKKNLDPGNVFTNPQTVQVGK